MSFDVFRDTSRFLDELHAFLAPYFGRLSSLCTVIDEAGRVVLTAKGTALLPLYIRCVPSTQKNPTAFVKVVWEHVKGLDEGHGDGVTSCILLTSVAMRSLVQNMRSTQEVTSAALRLQRRMSDEIFPCARRSFVQL